MPSISPSLSTSLPSYFRLRHLSPSSLTHPRSFFGFERARDDETPAPSVDSSLAKTRLEVLQAWEVNFAVLCLYLASAIALVYVVVKLDNVADHWQRFSQLPPLSTPENCFRRILQLGALALPLFFIANLVVYGRVTDEQIWTSVLLAVGLLATSPLTREPITSPHFIDIIRHNVPQWLAASFHTRTLSEATRASLIWNDAVYTAVIYLYLILAAHSYRVFDLRNIHSLSFYLPKLTIALLYFLVKVIAGFKADVSLGLIPFSRVLTWFFLLRSGRASVTITVPVLVMTALDTVFGFWLVREVAATRDFLATVPYIENRSKQLGFRCFVYQTLAFCFNIIILSCLIMCMIPRSFLYQTFDDPKAHLFQLEPPVARLALAFVYFTWTLVLAYVNLPPRPLLPFVQELALRCLYLVRNTRVAMWLGLTDIQDTEEAEDSSDDESDTASVNEEQNFNYGRPVSPILQPQPAIPFRYRHRELFDDIIPTPEQTHPIAPFRLTQPFSRLDSAPEPSLSYAQFASEGGDSESSPRNDVRVTFEDSYKELDEDEEDLEDEPASAGLHVSSALNLASRTQPIDIRGPSRPRARSDILEHTFDTCLDNLRSAPSLVGGIGMARGRRRLRMRKNLFVMETQIMMANAAYLSYIPGNEREERGKNELRVQGPSRSSAILHTGSLATRLDELDRQMAEESKLPSPPPLPIELKPQPDHDDGTMFLVDPYQMAERYGYRVYRHFSNEEFNTHAIVMISSARVIVAFSGTRDVTNWGVNAKVRRAVLDDKLSRFEYELSDGSDSSGDTASEESVDPFEDPYQSALHGIGAFTTHHQQRVRRSRSEERLTNQASSSEHNEISPLGTPNIRSYGSIPRGKHFLTSGEGSISRETSMGFATSERVTMMAKTYARELMTFGKPKVHVGFIDAYMSLRRRVMGALVELYRGRHENDVESPRDPNEEVPGPASTLPLFFSGHSLGGALATFASYEAARYYKRIGIRRRHDISCTTFGCPRIGNEAFKARYERLVETHWRFEIASDPVPKVPLVFLNYVHVGVQVLIDESGRLLLIDPSFIESSFIDVQWWGQLTNLYHGYRYHIRASYCMALRAYCKLYRHGADDLSERFWPFPIRIQTQGLFNHANR